MIYKSATGSLAAQFFAQSQGSWIANLCALGLGLAIPLHVIAIGLFLQRKWLSTRFTRAAWILVVVSGCWLGVSLGIRLLFLR
jgi:predicted transporter